MHARAWRGWRRVRGPAHVSPACYFIKEVITRYDETDLQKTDPLPSTASIGTGPNQANVLALYCPGCLAAVFGDVQQACPLDKGVTAIRYACILSFASKQILNFLSLDQWLVSVLVTCYQFQNFAK